MGESRVSALCFWKSLSCLSLQASNPTAFLGPKPVENQPVLGALLSTVLTLSLSVLREIFPYLVVVIGLENVLVLTKSVVSTPVDLEVKLRIAQGNTAGCGGAPGRAGGRAVCAGLPPAGEMGSPRRHPCSAL